MCECTGNLGNTLPGNRGRTHDVGRGETHGTTYSEIQGKWKRSRVNARETSIGGIDRETDDKMQEEKHSATYKQKH